MIETAPGYHRGVGVQSATVVQTKGHITLTTTTTTTTTAKKTLSTVEEDDMDPSLMKKLNKTGIITCLAIAVHNFPEGLATFILTVDQPRVGAAIAVAVALHNIPEGICVAMPIYYATGNRTKAFVACFLSGLSELLGAVVGYFLLQLGDIQELYGVLFGVVSGFMVYISLQELIPTALRYDPGNKYVTLSAFIGMAVMALSLVLFEI